MSRKTEQLLRNDVSEADVESLLAPIGFADWRLAHARLIGLCSDDERRSALTEALPMLLAALTESANPDSSILNLERFIHTVPDAAATLRFLADNPRAVEILVKLFVNSQFLTEILLRNPEYLERLTQHKRIADFKSREDFRDEAEQALATADDPQPKFETLRTYQHWELLRISACDNFGLLDLKSVTVQLSLLADAIVQTALSIVSTDLGVNVDNFVVLAFGKLGGEELNYSSDIDLVFVSRDDASRYWEVGQRLIRGLTDSLSGSFLYRVDMRLRPWGNSGPLVTTLDSYVEYLASNAELWEKQALLKARPIAGALQSGFEFLRRADHLLFEASVDEIRDNVRVMKNKIEDGLKRKGREFGEVKSGQGSIRDIEFVTQYLQLRHGRENKYVRSIGTLDGLIRLADFDHIQADEFRQLTTAYLLLRKIEHTLQLLHYKQVHSLPKDERELAYLARRLDFPNADAFLTSYSQHCAEVRTIYVRYIEDAAPLTGDETSGASLEPTVARQPRHSRAMEPSYFKVFSEEQILTHAKLLDSLSQDTPIVIDQQVAPGDRIQLTVCGFDQIGDLSMVCGLLFAYGFDIVSGNAFTTDDILDDTLADSDQQLSSTDAAKFVDVFVLSPPPDTVLSNVWKEFLTDLTSLVTLAREGQLRKAQASVVSKVAAAFDDSASTPGMLLPIDIEIDNEQSDRFTVLRISAEDTRGFIYELASSLTLLGYDIHRVTLTSIGDRAFDTLFIARQDGTKIVRPEMQTRLRAAVVLVKHFTHLLPQSPNPQNALLHFGQLLERLFERPNWGDELASLDRREVLEALAQLLGVSDFLWEDFLRLQHDNLFPVLRDVEGLTERRNRAQLEVDLTEQLTHADSKDEQRRCLNDFKDREMFRVDMRHIAGHISEFGQFSEELTDVAEAVTAAALRLCYEQLAARHGKPRQPSAEDSMSPLPLAGEVAVSAAGEGRPNKLAVLALGKAGGRELGFASDIELMFIYEAEGMTDGAAPITASEFYIHLVESLTKTIQARRKGIFEIDLRLRPYGSAGPLAVSLHAFEDYFAPTGPAWPYERQSLVRMRPIAGDKQLGEQVINLRDKLVYTEAPFDVNALRAMRERQLRQLVQPGVWNAKLSSGGLVDCEYLVQALQITHGHAQPELRQAGTSDALTALHKHDILTDQQFEKLHTSYVFLRRLIDALRMVRGDARDLAVPSPYTEEFAYLARRLNYGNRTSQLQSDIDSTTDTVTALFDMLLPDGKHETP
ncbi:MAG: glutamate-ammonia-ligase adenylyltransferase [Planctomycetaceae bacterium]|jgi:glutamate-ammonia-ligase adenylyltransferase